MSQIDSQSVTKHPENRPGPMLSSGKEVFYSILSFYKKLLNIYKFTAQYYFKSSITDGLLPALSTSQQETVQFLP
jgi:hypothetical protein